MPSITLRNVTKRYDKQVALDNIDLDVKSGEYMVILGPTGAGKTTLLRVIAGLTKPEKGEVLIDDRNITAKDPEQRNVSFMSQTYSLFPHLTVWDNVRFGPLVRGVPLVDTNRLAKEMLLLVALFDRSDAYPRELSGGMQQRTALARALTAGTNILLLDEPLRALDARLRIDLRLSLRKLCKDLRITALHVTHDQEEALLVADRLAIIRKGRIEHIGTSRQVYESPISPFSAHFLGEANFFIGRIEETDHEKTKIQSNGRAWIGQPSSLSKGQNACLAVKSENMIVSKMDLDIRNKLKAVVTRVLFLGKFVGLELKSSEMVMPVKVKLKAERAESISEGEELWLGFEPQQGMVFPVPSIGLAKELEVE